MIESAKASSVFIFDKLDKLQKQNSKELTKSELDRARAEVRESLLGSEKSLISSAKTEVEEYAPSRPLKIGDEVKVVSVGSVGTVIKAPDKDGNVTVRIGIVTTKTKLENLRLIETKGKKQHKKPAGAIGKVLAKKDFKTELDLRGMTGDEAWFAVDKYIDDAYLAGVFTVTLVHGKGTGALRNALWTAIKKEPRIASYRAGMYGEGDYGVTVIEIKH